MARKNADVEDFAESDEATTESSARDYQIVIQKDGSKTATVFEASAPLLVVKQSINVLCKRLGDDHSITINEHSDSGMVPICWKRIGGGRWNVFPPSGLMK